ncbi:hypothetical protein QV65_07660 [Rhodococcus erythropolis]|nr:hypothetical protein QV65_07660 [Rhodococcus erythropolis]
MMRICSPIPIDLAAPGAGKEAVNPGLWIAVSEHHLSTVRTGFASLERVSGVGKRWQVLGVAL